MNNTIEFQVSTDPETLYGDVTPASPADASAAVTAYHDAVQRELAPQYPGAYFITYEHAPGQGNASAALIDKEHSPATYRALINALMDVWERQEFWPEHIDTDPQAQKGATK